MLLLMANGVLLISGMIELFAFVGPDRVYIDGYGNGCRWSWILNACSHDLREPSLFGCSHTMVLSRYRF